MAENNIGPDINIDQGGGGGPSTTTKPKVLNRDLSDSGKVMDSSKYIFKNYPDGPGSFILKNTNMFPIVKIDGTYYVNDGEVWNYNDGNVTASLMDINYTFLWDNGNSILSKVNWKVKDSWSDSTYYYPWCDLSAPVVQKMTLSEYFVNDKHLEIWPVYLNKDNRHNDNEVVLKTTTYNNIGNFIGDGPDWDDSPHASSYFGIYPKQTHYPIFSTEGFKVDEAESESIVINGNTIQVQDTLWEFPANSKIVIFRRWSEANESLTENKKIQIHKTTYNSSQDNWITGALYYYQLLYRTSPLDNVETKAGMLLCAPSDPTIGWDKSSATFILSNMSASAKRTNKPNDISVDAPAAIPIIDYSTITSSLDYCEIDLNEDVKETLTFDPFNCSTSTETNLTWKPISGTKYAKYKETVTLKYKYVIPEYNTADKTNLLFCMHDETERIETYNLGYGDTAAYIKIKTSTGNYLQITSEINRPSIFKIPYETDLDLELVDGSLITMDPIYELTDKKKRNRSSLVEMIWEVDKPYTSTIPSMSARMFENSTQEPESVEIYTSSSEEDTGKGLIYYDGKVTDDKTSVYYHGRLNNPNKSYTYWVAVFTNE